MPPEFRNFNGSVELTCAFDRNDTIDAFFKSFNCNQFENKISLRRSIHSKQIEYFLCDSRVERVDVKNFLQIFGFEHSYPFQYSVQNDDLCTVEMSDSNYRLFWLQNCCGVGEFRAKKDKSKRILQETEKQIRKIDTSLSKINVQLNIFASDENQQIYQKWLKREKELGHFQRQYRVKRLQTDLQKWNSDMDMLTRSIESTKTDIIKNTENSKKIRLQIKHALNRISDLMVREREFEQEIQKRQLINTELEASIENLQMLTQQGAMVQELSTHEMSLYQERIDQTGSQISDFDAKTQRLAEEKDELDQQIAKLEAQSEAIILNCQQNQRLGTQFLSVANRNQYFLKQIKKAKIAINRENRIANKLKYDLQEDVTNLQHLRESQSECNKQLAQMNAEEEANSFHQHQQLIDELENRKWYAILRHILMKPFELR